MPPHLLGEDIDATTAFTATLDHFDIDDDEQVRTRVKSRLKGRVSR